MKMSKEDRDTYVENNYSSKTNKQLAADTGWSETTIKSIKTRLGVVKSSRVKELEEYVLSNGIKSVDEVNNAAIVLGCKPDKIRDVMKSLGIFENQSDKAFEALKLKYTGKFIFGEYKNTKAYVELTCVECKAVHYKRPNDLVTYNFSCTCIRKAIKVKQKEDSKIKAAALKIEKYFLELKERFPLVVAILPESKVEIECSSCLETRVLNRSSVVSRNPQKCNRCALDSKVTDATNRWVRYLEENNITLVRGDVLNDKSVVRVTRSCGHQIEATLGNIKRYQCTACRSGEEYYLYLLDAGNGVYKIGRAIDINRRIKTLNRYWEYELNCVHSVKGIYADIKMAEEYILKKYSSNRLFNTAVFDGATEFLELEDISELIEDMNSRF